MVCMTYDNATCGRCGTTEKIVHSGVDGLWFGLLDELHNVCYDCGNKHLDKSLKEDKMDIRQVVANFTIADEVKLELADDKDLTNAEADDIIVKYIDDKLKAEGIKAFNIQMTVRAKVIEKNE